MLHLIAPLGKNRGVDNKTVFFCSFRPTEFDAKMFDKMPVDGSPTPLTVFEPVKGDFLSSVERRGMEVEPRIEIASVLAKAPILSECYRQILYPTTKKCRP